MKKIILATTLTIAAMLFPSCDRATELPSVDRKNSSGKKLPSVGKAAIQELFLERFEKSKGSHHTVIVEALPSGKENAQMMKQIMSHQGVKVSDTEEFLPFLVGMSVVELKGISFETQSEDLTEADKLNGVEWKGWTNVRAKSERRRQLDLRSSFNKLPTSPGGVVVPWTARKLTWKPSKTFMQSMMDIAGKHRKEQSGEEQNDNEAPQIGALFDFGMGGLLKDEFSEVMSPTNWGDWVDAEGRSYLNAWVEIRKGVATVEANEDARGVLTEGDKMGIHPISTGSAGLLGMLSVDESVSFLIKPDPKLLPEIINFKS